tara:strand:+ start:141 stop:638 length:498 start_codon:yes stop_codon:yes gene_type:complete
MNKIFCKNKLIVFIISNIFFIIGCSQSEAWYGAGKSPNLPMKDKYEIQTKKVSPMDDKGVGPISTISLTNTIDGSMAIHGKELFENKCTACHSTDKRKIGPKLLGITKRRSPEWIMNMILNPEGMVKENEQAKELLMEYLAPMANQSLQEDEARAILEYFREIDV